LIIFSNCIIGHSVCTVKLAINNKEHIQMTPEEAEMVDKVKEIWDNHLRKKR